MKSGCRMIPQAICRYASVYCTLSFAVRCCRGLTNSLARKRSFPFSSATLVNWMLAFCLIKVVMKSVNFVFVIGGKSVVNVA